jgi:hypothetical protein
MSKRDYVRLGITQEDANDETIRMITSHGQHQDPIACNLVHSSRQLPLLCVLDAARPGSTHPVHVIVHHQRIFENRLPTPTRYRTMSIRSHRRELHAILFCSTRLTSPPTPNTRIPLHRITSSSSSLSAIQGSVNPASSSASPTMPSPNLTSRQLASISVSEQSRYKPKQ